eukprot:767555-Hanusia_phi.AAC.3
MEQTNSAGRGARLCLLVVFHLERQTMKSVSDGGRIGGKDDGGTGEKEEEEEEEEESKHV